MAREQNFQNIAWFKDLHTRGLLDMDPPYQRRSVWNRRFREDFVDTVLLGYPSPAIFLYEMIDEEKGASYAVVDGKQRLTTVLEFINNEFAVGTKSPIDQLRGLYYNAIPKEFKNAFLRYRFSVEVLPTVNEEELNSIFDRLNRNVKKLTAQELRHAKYDGAFITNAEQLAEWLDEQFSREFPKIADMSRRQMKDVEIVATLLLFLEEGAKSYSTATLDKAFSDRDEKWDGGATLIVEFQAIINYLQSVVEEGGIAIANSRFRNQADFYSLFGAIAELRREFTIPEPEETRERLLSFLGMLDAEGLVPPMIVSYLEAARSASNDAGPRRTRIDVIKLALLGEDLRANGAK